jgi:2-(1,2-epoxy-1,2-dihydrophenyl)acetyl-CoA isomerase
MVGLARATEILLLGERIPAERALELGLVNRVVPGAELERAVADLVGRLVELPTVALGWQKRCLHFGLQHDLPAALEHELEALLATFTSEDWREAIVAFAEKRKPRFQGK